MTKSAEQQAAAVIADNDAQAPVATGLTGAANVQATPDALPTAEDDPGAVSTPGALHPVPTQQARATGMPEEYSGTVRAFMMGKQTPSTKAGVRILENLKLKFAELQLLDKNIGEAQKTLGETQIQRSELAGRVESLASMIWEFETQP